MAQQLIRVSTLVYRKSFNSANRRTFTVDDVAGNFSVKIIILGEFSVIGEVC